MGHRIVGLAASSLRWWRRGLDLWRLIGGEPLASLATNDVVECRVNSISMLLLMFPDPAPELTSVMTSSFFRKIDHVWPL
jgi:hypothetical protein